MKQSGDLLQQGTTVYAEHALARIEEALTISSFSEKLREMKANVLFMVCYHLIMLINFNIIIHVLYVCHRLYEQVFM